MPDVETIGFTVRATENDEIEIRQAHIKGAGVVIDPKEIPALTRAMDQVAREIRRRRRRKRPATEPPRQAFGPDVPKPADRSQVQPALLCEQQQEFEDD